LDSAIHKPNQPEWAARMGRKRPFAQSNGFAGKARIDGHIKGDIHCPAILVGEAGVVIGNIYAEEAFIFGRVEGGICARSVTLYATGHVSGAILQQTLIIEPGAFFRGSCWSRDNPVAKYYQNRIVTPAVFQDWFRQRTA
jgi:cytoskeletal protein CcmA (bactofilin family)